MIPLPQMAPTRSRQRASTAAILVLPTTAGCGSTALRGGAATGSAIDAVGEGQGGGTTGGSKAGGASTLKFASSGVTHVIGLDGAEAYIRANFTTNASQQRYFPYLVTSNAHAWQNSQSDAVIKISAEAMPNMSGVGVRPLLDVGPNAQFGVSQKRSQAACTKAEPTQFGAPVKTHHGKGFGLNTFYSNCNAFFLIKKVLEVDGMPLDPARVRAGFNLLKSKAAASAALTNGRLGGPTGSTDGSGFVQAFVHDKRKIFVYDGSPMPVTS